MKFFRYFPTFPLVAVLFLGGCTLSPEAIDRQGRDAVVLINYPDQAGFGTGFLVQHGGSGCAALTAAHVVEPSPDRLYLTVAQDNQSYQDLLVTPAEGYDLALIRFQPEGSEDRCPYVGLPLGVTQNMTVGNSVWLIGYPERAGNAELRLQTFDGKVTTVELPREGGLGIAYNIISATGMSGGPVLNHRGQVVAIHSRADRDSQGNEFVKWGVDIQLAFQALSLEPPVNPWVAVLPGLSRSLLVMLGIAGTIAGGQRLLEVLGQTLKRQQEEADRLQQQQETRRQQKEADRLQQQREAQRKQEEADRLRQQQETKRQQEEADRLRQQREAQRKQEEADRLRQQQLEAQRQQTTFLGLLVVPYRYTTARVSATGQVTPYKANSPAGKYTETALKLPAGAVLLEMVAIPGGTFTMGSPESEAERFSAEGPQHQVTVPDFFMGRYTVTQAQWFAVMGSDYNANGWQEKWRSLDSKFKKDQNQPIVHVNWDDAQAFIQRLNRLTGKTYRLPTEAEWEYAARAGTTTPFSYGETITPEVVNYDGNYPYGRAPKGEYRERTIAVDTLYPNPWGLYHIHGNVWEWVEDGWHDNYNGAPTDGTAWLSSDELRLLRGGSWDSDAGYTRSAVRVRLRRDGRNILRGFRLVFSGRTP